MLRRRLTLEPCLPRPTKEPPAGPGWIHEIKHDGFRILARRDAKGVRLFTRNGYDFTPRFPKIVDAVASLPVRSCVVDGEAVVVDERGLSVFDALRYRLGDHAAVLCAFDLIELDGEDTRGERLENRKRALADLLRGTDDGIAFNKHFDGDGAIVFRHACALGCEGIVSKRLGHRPRTHVRRAVEERTWLSPQRSAQSTLLHIGSTPRASNYSVSSWTGYQASTCC